MPGGHSGDVGLEMIENDADWGGHGAAILPAAVEEANDFIVGVQEHGAGVAGNLESAIAGDVVLAGEVDVSDLVGDAGAVVDGGDGSVGESGHAAVLLDRVADIDHGVVA